MKAQRPAPAVETQASASARSATPQQATTESEFPDNRPDAIAQRKLADAIRSGPYVAAQRQQFQSMFGDAAQFEAKPEALSNKTGLPDNLKSGVESLSGMSLDSVKVHYNSAKPAQLDAFAYAQGSDIHVAPGQEKHLPHEAWHVVQQAEGRVRPTMQLKDGVPVNDDAGLEHEADVMGAKALSHVPPVQRMRARPKPMGARLFAPVQRAGVIQRDDVVEGQTDPGDLVDGVAEVTGSLSGLSLSGDGDEESTDSPQSSPFSFGGSGGFGLFGQQPQSSQTPSPFGPFGQQPTSGFGQQPTTTQTPSPWGSFGQQPTLGFGQQPTTNQSPSPFGPFGQQPTLGFGQQPTTTQTPSPWGTFGQQPTPGFGQQPTTNQSPSPWGSFGQPSTLGFGQSLQPPSQTNHIFGSGFGGGQQTFESFASQSQTSGFSPWGQQPPQNSQNQSPWFNNNQNVQFHRKPGAIVQRIGAGKVQAYKIGGIDYQFTTTAGGFVNFDGIGGTGGGDGPFLGVVADVNIMDPPAATKLNVPPGYRKTNPKQNPPLKNERHMHFLAANWVRNGSVSMVSPGTDTWHHHKDKGRMQLIDGPVHGKIKHNGGHSTWGKK